MIPSVTSARMLLAGGICRGRFNGGGGQEGHAGDGGHERGHRRAPALVGQPAPVDQRGACVAERAEQHGPGAEKLHRAAPEVDAQQGDHARRSR